MEEGGVLTIPMQPAQPQTFQVYQRPNARTFQRRGPPQDAKGGAPDGDTATGPVMFDGKRMRKAVHRKTVDYNTAVLQYLEVCQNSEYYTSFTLSAFLCCACI